MVKLFRKNSNLCDHNPPTSQTNRGTDDMRSQDGASLCTKVHRAVKNKLTNTVGAVTCSGWRAWKCHPIYAADRALIGGRRTHDADLWPLHGRRSAVDTSSRRWLSDRHRRPPTNLLVAILLIYGWSVDRNAVVISVTDTAVWSQHGDDHVAFLVSPLRLRRLRAVLLQLQQQQQQLLRRSVLQVSTVLGHVL